MLKRFWHSEDGVTAIEFGIVALPLFLLLGTILEVSVIFFTEYQIQDAAQHGARLIRTGKVSTVSPRIGPTNPVFKTQTEFKTELCTKIMVSNCTSSINVDVQAAANFQTLKNNLPASALNVGGGGPNPSYVAQYNPTQAGEAGSVIVTYDWPLFFPGMSLMGNIKGKSVRRLAGMSVFRSEMFQ